MKYRAQLALDESWLSTRGGDGIQQLHGARCCRNAQDIRDEQKDHGCLEKVYDLLAKHGRLQFSTSRHCRRPVDVILEWACCRPDALAVSETPLLLSRSDRDAAPARRVQECSRASLEMRADGKQRFGRSTPAAHA
jgi:hypothetical protein